MREPIVAIDGPAGAGKSTVARGVASKLGYVYVDTGALYRAVGLAAIRRGIAFEDDDRLGPLVAGIDIVLGTNDDGTTVVKLDGEDVSSAIRTPEVSAAASAVSARGPVRAGLLDLQRRLGGSGGSVLEGRDIGTVVFPDAEVKIFLTATDEERARRRHAELVSRRTDVSYEQVLAEQRQRDANDSGRKLAPLKPADDAIQLASDGLTVDQVIAAILTRVEASRSLPGD